MEEDNLIGTRFQRKDLEKTAEVITVKLNKEEREQLDEMKLVLEQPKDSTALKQLSSIGAKVLLSDQTQYLLQTVFKNKRKNRRLGITDFD